MSNESRLLEGLDTTRSRLAAAAAAHDRKPSEIRLLAVSKQQSADAIRIVAAAGQRDFGENYVQEALPKMALLGDLPLTWHFIGQIQGNKTRVIAEHFDWVHTLDRQRIAQRLSEQRPQTLRPLQACIQVKFAEEAGKGGVWPEELAGLVAGIVALPGLQLRGLMCIPPPRDAFDEQREHFDRLAGQLTLLRQAGYELDTLSMGMSGDLEAAVAAGATIVRVGTAIFGPRT